MAPTPRLMPITASGLGETLLLVLVLLRGSSRHVVAACRGTGARRRLRGERRGTGHRRGRAMRHVSHGNTSHRMTRHFVYVPPGPCRSACDARMRCSQLVGGRSLRWCDVGAHPGQACAAAPPTAAAPSRRQSACRPQRARVCAAAARKRAQGDASTGGDAVREARTPPQRVPVPEDDGAKDFWEGEQWETLGTAASYGIAVVALLGGACVAPLS